MPTILQTPPFVVGMPTETVYGLAARIDEPRGIEGIFRIKERPFFDPLIVHVASIEQAKTLTTDWSKVANALALKFWPGPLTLVLPKSEIVSDLITSGLQSVGIRMPRHSQALELIRAEGMPLAAPSANKFGKTSPTKAAHVRAEFGDLVPVIDGGACEVGLESTVLLVKSSGAGCELSILRPGAIGQTEISETLNMAALPYQWVTTVSKKESPGHMKHHYMPEIPLIFVRAGSALQHEGSVLPELVAKIQTELQNLPETVEGVRLRKPQGLLQEIERFVLSDEPAIAARELYAKLRTSSAQKPDVIIFFEKELHRGAKWEALLDRLTKASSLIVE